MLRVKQKPQCLRLTVGVVLNTHLYTVWVNIPPGPTNIKCKMISDLSLINTLIAIEALSCLTPARSRNKIYTNKAYLLVEKGASWNLLMHSIMKQLQLKLFCLLRFLFSNSINMHIINQSFSHRSTSQAPSLEASPT